MGSNYWLYLIAQNFGRELGQIVTRKHFGGRNSGRLVVICRICQCFYCQSYVLSQGKISCKILDTVQEKGYFLCKILTSLKFLTRFL